MKTIKSKHRQKATINGKKEKKKKYKIHFLRAAVQENQRQCIDVSYRKLKILRKIDGEKK